MNTSTKLTTREYFTRREFEHYMRKRGATKSQALKAMNALPPGTMRAMLPLWTRARIAWKARHD